MIEQQKHELERTLHLKMDAVIYLDKYYNFSLLKPFLTRDLLFWRWKKYRAIHSYCGRS